MATSNSFMRKMGGRIYIVEEVLNLQLFKKCNEQKETKQYQQMDIIYTKNGTKTVQLIE